MRTIFFDMDGVLADFVGGALAAHGKTLDPAAVQWDFCSQIGFAGPGDPAFWSPLSNPEFWATLPPLPDGMELFRRAEAEFGAGRIGILSSGLCPGSCDGKRAWLKKHLPAYEKRAIFCTVKELVAAPCKVLVDDYEPNHDAFVAAGGRAVLAPRPWNRRRELTGEAGRFDPAVEFGHLRNVATRE